MFGGYLKMAHGFGFTCFALRNIDQVLYLPTWQLQFCFLLLTGENQFASELTFYLDATT